MSDLDQLLAAIGAAPVLPGARCRGRHHLFDAADPGEDPETVAARHSQALGLCSRCPAQKDCKTWFLSLKPSKRPPGICAGLNPRKDAA
jgi:Transcription factor WhiB